MQKNIAPSDHKKYENNVYGQFRTLEKYTKDERKRMMINLDERGGRMMINLGKRGADNFSKRRREWE